MTRAFFACLLLLISSLLSAGTCGQADLRAHGVITYESAWDCWKFTTDAGDPYAIAWAPANVLRDGLAGLAEAIYAPNADTARSACGVLIDLCSFSADNTIKLVGTLRYFDIAGGCYRLETPNKVYAPLSEDSRLFHDGAQVKVEGIYLPNVCSACQAPVLQVIDYEFIGSCAGQCRNNYRDCMKVCSNNPCLVSCDTVFGNCLDSCQ